MKRTIVLRRALVAGIALPALLVTAACGDGDDTAAMDHGSGSPAVSASATAAASFNDADVMFAQMMIPHHRQAVEMANLAPTRASDPELQDLAAKIKAAQDPEIVTMTGWLTAWGKPTSAPSNHDMHGMDPSATPGMSSAVPGSSDMAGMASEQEMNALDATKGADFDRMFAQLMIAHHNGAIEMAKAEQANGANSDAKALAVKIAADQATEVQTLQKILDRL